jgi:hypothetical protein
VRLSPEESGLPMETVFLCFQVRSLDKGRFPAEPAGQLSEEKMLQVEATVRYCLGLWALGAIAPLLSRENALALAGCDAFA